MFRSQSASEHATSTSRQNYVQIQYSNPSRLETGARANGLGFGLVWARDVRVRGYRDIDIQAS